ncbi:uncharacterized protein PV06_00359 [Exophiala oligosperma]|uniref:Uncharacterized protein n=2 Tax=Chaetothyriales TaxID=34395 RepID=A0A0D2DYM0_9EURO|nr:uncharacterized protein PV06_00359 [Exophiala oligosperma]KAJ9647659.1 hypothetical protein H2204_000289 [Knufia peltigerae]KIW47690.1 hypothetical protein PV06_00359 [Exophiala oligosperma]
MEEPIRKRPRLSMFADQSEDDVLDQDLDALRDRNDNLLKSRFESIFEKYSHNFEGFGDEINLWTGEVEVDNGHLQGLRDETDIGDKGSSLLRAMTEAEDTTDSYFNNEGADEVMQSIEEIAENAAEPNEDQEEDENDEDCDEDQFQDQNDVDLNSDDELFAPVQQVSTSEGRHNSFRSSTAARSQGSASDCDSLFEVQNTLRSDSPDSLFEVQEPQEHFGPRTTTRSSTEMPQDYREIDEVDIMEKFGPEIGNEVLEIVQTTRNMAESHIEPAWRIPANIIPLRARRSTSRSHTPAQPMRLSPQPEQPVSPQNSRSLWKPPKPRRTAQQMRTMRFRRSIRAVSEDPLQEDFRDDLGHPEANAGSDSGDDSEWREDEKPRSRKRREDDEHIELMRQGICSFCRVKYSSRAGVFSHWSHLVTKAEKTGTDPDDIHDLTYIRKYRSKSHMKPKTARLCLCDFKTMVEMHEGAGVSFAEIASSKVLRTRKTAPILNDLYDKFRTPAGHDELDTSPEWSEEELKILDDLSQKPLQELGTFTRFLKDRSNTEVGNKLAESWLVPFRERRRLRQNGDHPRTLNEEEWSGGHGAFDHQYIKTEDSDDELFGNQVRVRP